MLLGDATMGSRYNADDELHVRRDDLSAQSITEKARVLYTTFTNKYKQSLDYRDINSIPQVYAAAQEAGVFEQAKTTREFFFGRDMHFYGVTYLWDICMESCVYCPAAVENRMKAKYKPLELSISEAVKDVKYVMGDGHRHVCVLTGEDPVRHSPEVLAEYIAAIDSLGLTEIILNVEPPADLNKFRLWRDAAKNTSLQFRVFQETYDRNTYAQIHPVTKHGRKHDFDFRYRSQFAALDHGFDNVGIGVLFGNHAYPIEEVDALKEHAELIFEEKGKWPARVCLPSAKYLEKIEVRIAHSLDNAAVLGETDNLYWLSSELLYALTRLALPHINIVSSERDSPELLAVLNQYATCCTLNVHPGVGDNIRFHEGIEESGTHFEQSPTYPRDPRNTVEHLTQSGYRPILGSLA